MLAFNKNHIPHCTPCQRVLFGITKFHTVIGGLAIEALHSNVRQMYEWKFMLVPSGHRLDNSSLIRLCVNLNSTNTK
mgnify:CR=1 FL=1